MKGTISKHLSDKGYGFILAEDGSELFFHRSSCISSFTQELGAGKKVKFEVEKSPKGLRAVSVALT